MVTEAGMVPAFRSVTLHPPGQFSRAVQDWASAGGVYPWPVYELPSGFGMDVLGPIFSQMAAGQINVTEFVRLFTNAVATVPALR
jgi:raffinose/stachyose/melibiose transport system substrate-binding protein